MRQLHEKGKKAKPQKAYICFSMFRPNWKAESVCWTRLDAGISLARSTGDTHCSQV